MAILSNNGSVGLLGSGVDTGYQIEKSLRFDDGDTAYLNKTPSGSGNKLTWTWSGWVKRCKLGADQTLFGAGDSSVLDSKIHFNSSDQLVCWNYTASAYKSNQITTARYRDPTAWYHIVVSCNGTTSLKIYVNGVEQSLGTDTGPDGTDWYFNTASKAHNLGRHITASSYFDGWMAEVHWIDGSALDPSSFGETNATTGQWVPIKYAGSHGTNGFHFKFNGTDIGEDSAGSNDWTVNNLSTGVYTGTKPKWYTADTLYTTKSDITSNGTDRGQSGFTLSSEEFVYLIPNSGGVKGAKAHPAGSTWPSLVYGYASNDTAWINTGSYGTSEPTVFEWEDSSASYGDSYDYATNAQAYLIGDTRVGGLPDANSKMTGTFPALVNIVPVTDVSTDTPTTFDDEGNGTGNYCTLNPLASAGALSQGNLTQDGGAGTYYATSTMGFTSGKWYGEFTLDTHAYPGIGVCYEADPQKGWMATEAPYYFIYDGGSSLSSYPGGAMTWNSGSTIAQTLSPGVFQIALDVDNGKCWIGYQDTWYNNEWNTSGSAGNPATGANPTFTLPSGKTWYFFLYSNGAKWTTNFGQRAFEETKPSGFSSPNTYNLTDPTIAKPTAHVNAVLYTGTGSSQTISEVGFQPDLTWTVRRNGANANYLFNSVAGVSEVLYPTHDAGADPFSDFAFTSDGFTADGTEGGFNANTNTFVAWNWLAASANVTDSSTGSISSTYRANTTAGFSIVKYTGNSTTGATISHGLNATPDFAMFKSKTDAEHWNIYHKDMGNTHYLQFDTGDKEDDDTAWNDTNPTTTVMTLGNKGAVNRNTAEIRAFLWSEVDGYSKFGSYEGNGNADGPFVWCGFKPAILFLKNIDDGGNWVFLDNERLGYNPDNNSQLIPVAGAENTIDEVDFLATGFKLRTSLGWRNASAKTHIFAAWAESPFKYSNAQ